ncbi:MAG TPA: hypothetical protein VFX19_03975 [Dehalococcoidia bacterium]|nr:hypothetical protein [Dehalococcoidia bacterium]
MSTTRAWLAWPGTNNKLITVSTLHAVPACLMRLARNPAHHARSFDATLDFMLSSIIFGVCGMFASITE